MISEETYHSLIGQIYDAPLSGKWAPVLDNILDALNANKAFFFLQRLTENLPVIVNMQCNFSFPNEALLEYQTRPLEDPLYHVTKTITQGDALNINDFMNMKDHEGTEYFNSVLKPMRSYYAMAGILKRDGKYESPFAVARWKDQAPFNNDELDLMKKLTTHMGRALDIFLDLQMYRNKSLKISALLESQDSAQFLCDEFGRILHSNLMASKYLSGYHHIFSLDNILTIENIVLNKRLKTLIKHCSFMSFNEIETQETLSIQANNQYSALITVSPFNQLNESNSEREKRCFVTIKLRQEPDIDSFQQAFKLTGAETNLIKGLSRSCKLSTLAEELGKSHQTLRNQMQSIYRKCGVDSQISLMAKLQLF